MPAIRCRPSFLQLPNSRFLLSHTVSCHACLRPCGIRSHTNNEWAHVHPAWLTSGSARMNNTCISAHGHSLGPAKDSIHHPHLGSLSTQLPSPELYDQNTIFKVGGRGRLGTQHSFNDISPPQQDGGLCWQMVWITGNLNALSFLGQSRCNYEITLFWTCVVHMPLQLSLFTNSRLLTISCGVTPPCEKWTSRIRERIQKWN